MRLYHVMIAWYCRTTLPISCMAQERGELLGLLTDQLQGLAAMRSALAGEARVAEVSAQWAAALKERDKLLTEDVSSPVDVRLRHLALHHTSCC